MVTGNENNLENTLESGEGLWQSQRVHIPWKGSMVLTECYHVAKQAQEVHGYSVSLGD